MKARIKKSILRKSILLSFFIHAINLYAPHFQHPLSFLLKPQRGAPTPSWHENFPTLGLRCPQKPNYPFLPHFFSLHDLAPRQAKGITIAIIDTEPNTENVSHATHNMRLLRSLCPKATIHLISPYKKGTCTKAELINAIQQAADSHVDILALPLKIDSSIKPTTPASQLLNKELARIPYIIAAAGNDGTNNLAYPARFTSTTLSAGAFGYANNECFIPDFSQYEPAHGPTFLLPGVAITTPTPPQIDSALHKSSTQPARPAKSTSFLTNTEKSMTGTSSSTILLAGFIALLLAENENLLSKEQLLSLIFNCSVTPDDSPEWLIKSLHGTPDMRMTLFILNILKKTSSKTPLKKISLKKFQNRLHSLKKVLLKPINEYAEELYTRHHIKNPSKNNLLLNSSKKKKRQCPNQTTQPFTSNVLNVINQTNQYQSQEVTHPLCITFSKMNIHDATTNIDATVSTVRASTRRETATKRERRPTKEYHEKVSWPQWAKI